MHRVKFPKYKRKKQEVGTKSTFQDSSWPLYVPQAYVAAIRQPYGVINPVTLEHIRAWPRIVLHASGVQVGCILTVAAPVLAEELNVGPVCTHTHSHLLNSYAVHKERGLCLVRFSVHLLIDVPQMFIVAVMMIRVEASKKAREKTNKKTSDYFC